ncbi:DUF6376 family protein [Paenibacillus silvisoli]|uniref:DUF6376 family protein n=1 Tax=Paenibacillus silvisoli TaxID=3110539 RepID=UPI002805F2C8|nr:DUF6376 family protein [Paenibacillus silvisoli]
MRKLMLLLVVFSTMLLSACSLLEGANKTVEYVDQATTHVNYVANFAEQAPQMIKAAATDPEIKQKLEDQLLALKQEVEQFNLIEAPKLAKDIHQQLVDKNQALLQEIDKVVQNGHVALDQLQNSQLVTTITDITSLLNRIQQLGL